MGGQHIPFLLSAIESGQLFMPMLFQDLGRDRSKANLGTSVSMLHIYGEKHEIASRLSLSSYLAEFLDMKDLSVYGFSCQLDHVLVMSKEDHLGRCRQIC